MKKLFSLLTLCLLGTGLLLAQTKDVSGIVVDEKGEPIIGASIQVEGTSVGTITDYDGEFALSVPEDAKNVVVTYVGMAPQTVAITPNMRITLKDNTEQLEEVVVTGYGVVSKGSFGGSAQAVSSDVIESKNSSEVTKALAGEIAGVQVINSSGQPGTNATIRIRGVGSLNGNASPLYVVDGVAYNGDISAIDPGDIASTTVLKDASATSLYGSRGANGVIVITTKKGNTHDEGHIDVDVKYGGNMRLLPIYESITSPEEFVTMSWMSLYNGYKVEKGMSEENAIKAANSTLFTPNGSSTGIPEYYNLWDQPGNLLVNPYDNFGNVVPTFNSATQRRKGYENLESWKDAIFRVGQKAEATVKFHGGTEKVQYFTSFGYLKDEGYYQSSDFDRFNVRSNIDYQPKKWLKANLNLSYAYTSFNNPDQNGDGAMNNGFYYLNAIPAIYPVYLRDKDGNIAIDQRTGKAAYDYGDADLDGNVIGRPFGYGINPAGAVRVDKERQVAHNVNATGMFEITLYKGLKFTATVGAQFMNDISSELTNKWYGDAAGLGRIRKMSINDFFLQANQQFDYSGTFGDHTVRAMAGHETQYFTENYVLGYMSNLADGESLELSNAVKMQSISGSKEGYTMESYYVLASYMYKERYFIQGNYRADGSSRYAAGHRWGHFGGVSASWVMSSEDWMQPASHVLKNLKLRASWGLNGNQMSSLYSYTDLYSIENVGDEIAYIWYSKGNPNITWERSNMVDVGLDLSISKYLDFEFDFFHKVTDNMLFPRAVAPSLGYSTIPTNDAKMLNQGVEFTFNIHAVNTRNVKLDIRLNGAHYKNKMLQMPVDYYKSNGEAVRMKMGNGGMAEGHSLYDHYTVVYGGVDDDGRSLFQAYYDAKITDEKGNPVGFNGIYTDPETGLTTRNYIHSKHQYELDQKEKGKEYELKDTMTIDYALAASQYVGKSYLPDINGGLGINLEVYGVTLDIATSYQIGGYGYDYTYQSLMANDPIGKHNWHVDMRNAWTEATNDAVHALPIDQQIPRLSNQAGQYDQYANSASTRFLTSNSYFSLNSITLGYNFPKKLIEKAKMNKLNLYVSATNLAIATARKGYNPMTSFTGSSDTHGYSPLSTIMGGIKVTF